MTSDTALLGDLFDQLSFRSTVFSINCLFDQSSFDLPNPDRGHIWIGNPPFSCFRKKDIFWKKGPWLLVCFFSGENRKTGIRILKNHEMRKSFRFYVEGLAALFCRMLQLALFVRLVNTTFSDLPIWSHITRFIPQRVLVDGFDQLKCFLRSDFS